ncbi:MAG TPA: nuclear transport factor 2 family protein [Croceicoccus sp.]|nr:nuclear transport factor 2 family protein [Croceicoccus sp.]
MTLEERIQRMEDRDAIRELIAKYAHGLDLPDRDLFLSVWAEDAVYKVDEPFGETVGLEAIGKAWDSFHVLFPYQYHHTMNVVVDGPHGDKASATSFVLVTGADREGTAWTASCAYFDEFARIDGTWKFTRRYDRVHYMRPWLDPANGQAGQPPLYLQIADMERLMAMA